MDRDRFATWVDSLRRRSGAADGAGGALPLPPDIRVRACIDGADEAECVASYLRAWRLMGIAPGETAVLSGSKQVAERLAGGAVAHGVRVGEIGSTDISGVRALALVGCDARFFAEAAEPDGFGAPEHEQERIRPLLSACAAPRGHLLVTWRGRPEKLFGALAE